ncbi:hypothetical protein BDK51DRAFT_25560 [Blyttiomyces helicus]|uniref:Uncharacterized protein n=1 Tax=Blyttiomyces helicus TaxID=388810 RepID=A0A4P9W5V8_9FUNG|nr:hypothetical protein BDK51DRAFT_25560 [Blyttiomyces helicus]|eukprot:RKO86715.1 hypothetical protein BDK51DRAFT_25560 [Blyttiomyces helicus]
MTHPHPLPSVLPFTPTPDKRSTPRPAPSKPYLPFPQPPDPDPGYVNTKITATSTARSRQSGYLYSGNVHPTPSHKTRTPIFIYIQVPVNLFFRIFKDSYSDSYSVSDSDSDSDSYSDSYSVSDSYSDSYSVSDSLNYNSSPRKMPKTTLKTKNENIQNRPLFSPRVVQCLTRDVARSFVPLQPPHSATLENIHAWRYADIKHANQYYGLPYERKKVDALRHLGNYLSRQKGKENCDERSAPAGSSTPAPDPYPSILKEKNSARFDTLSRNSNLHEEQIRSLVRKMAVVEALGEQLLQSSNDVIATANKAKEIASKAKDGFEGLCAITSRMDADIKRLENDWSSAKHSITEWSKTVERNTSQTTEFQKETRSKLDEIVNFIQNNVTSNENQHGNERANFRVRTYIHDHQVGGIITKLAPDLDRSLNVVTTLDHTVFNRQKFAQAQSLEGRTQLGLFHPSIQTLRFFKVAGSEESLDCFFKTLSSQLEKRTYRQYPSILLWGWE